MGPVFLHGGGREPDASLWQPFLAATQNVKPRIAVVVLATDGPEEIFNRWLMVLRRASSCSPYRVDVTAQDPLTVGQLDGADAVFVGHGLTPDYAKALAPNRDGLQSLPIPYAGSSAGAAAASTHALVGGWLLDDRPVCPEDSAEDLDPLTVDDGLGLVNFAVDVHAAQWGTLSRLVAAVDAGLVEEGYALDEETVLRIDGRSVDAREVGVIGTGHAWRVTPGAVERVVGQR